MRAPSLHRGPRPSRSSSPLVKREHFLARCLHAFWTRASKPKTDLRVPEREPRRPSAPDRPDAWDVDGNALVPPRRDGAPGAPEVGGRPPPAAVLPRAGVPARAAARPRPAPRAGPPHDHDRPRDPRGADVRGPPADDPGHEVHPLVPPREGRRLRGPRPGPAGAGERLHPPGRRGCGEPDPRLRGEPPGRGGGPVRDDLAPPPGPPGAAGRGDPGPHPIGLIPLTPPSLFLFHRLSEAFTSDAGLVKIVCDSWWGLR